MWRGRGREAQLKRLACFREQDVPKASPQPGLVLLEHPPLKPMGRELFGLLEEWVRTAPKEAHHRVANPADELSEDQEAMVRGIDEFEGYQSSNKKNGIPIRSHFSFPGRASDKASG